MDGLDDKTLLGVFGTVLKLLIDKVATGQDVKSEVSLLTSLYAYFAIVDFEEAVDINDEDIERIRKVADVIINAVNEEKLHTFYVPVIFDGE